MTGAIAQYGRGTGVMVDIANHIAAAFAQNLETLLAWEGMGAGNIASAPPEAAPISVFALLRVMLRGFFARWFGRLFGGARP
jgi:hypothetical protein